MMFPQSFLKPAPLVAALALSACSSLMPPDHVDMVAPPQWHAPLPHQGTVLSLTQWWQQQGDPLLVELITAAQAVSPTVAQAMARVEAARAQQAAAHSALLPNVSAQVAGSRGVSQPGLALTTLQQAGLQAQWEIDLVGANRAVSRAAQANVAGSQAQWHDARVSVAAEVANLYYGLSTCTRQLALAQRDAASRQETARLTEINAKAGFLWNMGALDFAGGTVVHINAAVAGLVGAFMIGKRVGYGREAMAPHSLPLTMVGASLLWVGWFGFNAGSALEAGNSAVLAFMNTFTATAAAVLAWCLGEALMRGKASMLGAASGAVAGLVAITPAAGNVGLMGAIVIGFIAGFACLWGVHSLKKLLGADDSLDVFGVHGVGGIVGALLTGVFNTQDLGGPGLVTDWVTATVGSNGIGAQVWVQAKAVGLTVIWSAVVAAVSFKIVDLVIGLRVTEEEEREGLDISSHGETAFSK